MPAPFAERDAAQGLALTEALAKLTNLHGGSETGMRFGLTWATAAQSRVRRKSRHGRIVRLLRHIH